MSNERARRQAKVEQEPGRYVCGHGRRRFGSVARAAEQDSCGSGSGDTRSMSISTSTSMGSSGVGMRQQTKQS